MIVFILFPPIFPGLCCPGTGRTPPTARGGTPPSRTPATGRLSCPVCGGCWSSWIPADQKMDVLGVALF